MTTDLGEKILLNENNTIAYTNRIIALESALLQEKATTLQMSHTVDNLEQANRASNLFVSGLTDERSTKEGFAQFCNENLQIPADADDIKTIIKIPSEREKLHKFIFRSPDVREKFYSARRLLKNHKDIWFRDDLIKKRELLAKHIRAMVKLGQIKRTWTDHGVILIIRNGEEKPTRIYDVSEL